MGLPDLARMSGRFAGDPELARAVRFWTGALILADGDARSALRFEAGRFAGAGASAAPAGPRDVEIAAAPAQWEKLLAAVPPPFYQDVFGASLHHPVSLGGDVETLYAYYAAIRRVIEILREARA